MIAMGLVIGMNLDFYHRVTIRFVKAFWTRMCWDLLFWMAQVLLVFYVLLRVNEGELRFYIFLALIVGFWIYRRHGRKPFLRWMEVGFSFVKWVKRVCIGIIRVFVVSPVKFLLKLIISSVMIGLTICGNVLMFILNLLLFPLKIIARLLRPMVKKFLPRSFVNLIERTFQIIKKRVKQWRIFK